MNIGVNELTKKRILLVLALMGMIAFAAVFSGGHPQILSLQAIRALSEEQAVQALAGIHRNDIIAAWGKPDASLSGMFGDIYGVGDSGKAVIVYYDADSVAEAVKMDILK